MTEPLTDTRGPLSAGAELVVVGAGLMGSMTAWAAARRGTDVLVLEQFDLGHAHGSSHGTARIFRRAYPDPLFVRLSGPARRSWAQLEVDAGVRLLDPVGGLDHGVSRDPAEIARVLDGCEVEHTVCSADEAEARWPGLRFDGPVVFHADGACIDAAGAVSAALRSARANGARVEGSTTVLALAPDDDEVVVGTDRGDVRAHRVVVAAGGWTEDLLSGLVDLPPLRVSEEAVFHFPIRDGVDPWPCVVHGDADAVFYHLPAGADVPGARKIGQHFSGEATTATTRTGRIDPAVRERVVQYARDWLPGLVPEPFAETTCLYTSTASEDFVLDRVGPLVVCSPCSGHGAKFAPLIGTWAAGLAAGDPPPEPRFTLAAHRRASSQA